MGEILDEIIKSRILFINKEITRELANEIIMELLYLDSVNNNDINLYINSPGGDVMAGLAIIDTMNIIKSNVNTICIGSCYSMAAIILICGNKGKRAMLPNSEIMIHEVGITHIDGQTKEVVATADRMKEKNDKIISILAEKTKLKKKKILEIISTDYFMDSKEALEKEFVDIIL